MNTNPKPQSDASPESSPGFMGWTVFVIVLLLLLPVRLVLSVAGAIAGIIDGFRHPEKYQDQPEEKER